MKNVVATAAVLCLGWLSASSAHAQGATQAVRNAAEGLQQTVDNNQAPLTAGPSDKREKTAPGKVDQTLSREFTTTRSGLKYRVLRDSQGRKPVAEDSVTVHYKGWLDNNNIFDSSYRRGETTSFPLKSVIPGWTEGMQLIGEGGMIELMIPHQLGYGERGTPGGPIPPRAQLHFVVELISVK